MVTPVPGLVTQTPNVAGQPVNAVAANQSGGYITNPYSAADQGLSLAESLFINPTGPAATSGWGTTLELRPGQTFLVIPGSTLPTSVASASANHRFTCVQWP